MILRVVEKWFCKLFFFRFEKSCSANLDFFLIEHPEKKVGLYYKSTFFQVGEIRKVVVRVQIKKLIGFEL